MEPYIKPVDIRWSDLDPNFHLRHSVYYDLAAYCRISYFNDHRLSLSFMMKQQIGVVLFREECIFRKEIVLGDMVNVDLCLIKARQDFSRWSIHHRIYKNDNILAATITVDGAWIDTVKRKLTIPPAEVQEIFRLIPQSEGFEWS